MANNHHYPGLQLSLPLDVVMDAPQSFAPSTSFQFCPATTAPQPQQFYPMGYQNFQPLGRDVVVNHRLPSEPHLLRFMPSMHQLSERPGKPGHVQSLSVGPPILNGQLNGPITSRISLPQSIVQTPNSCMPGLGGLGPPLSSSLPFAFSNGSPMVAPVIALAEYQPSTEISAPNIHAGAQRVASISQATALASPMQHPCEQRAVMTASLTVACVLPKPSEEAATDWIEHASSDGRRYFFNRRTRQSTWEKPFELMTPLERADATTNWKEYTSPDGRKYYYNKATKQSKWSMPEELKIARGKIEQASVLRPQIESTSTVKMPSLSDTVCNPAQAAPSSPAPLTTPTSITNEEPALASEWAASAPKSSPIESVNTVQMPAVSASSLPATVENAASSTSVANTTSMTLSDMDNILAEEGKASDGTPVEDAKQGSGSTGPDKHPKTLEGEKFRSSLEEKSIDQEPVLFTDKMEAKVAFKSLLGSANVGSDWTWEQAMRVIINDRRYGALRTLGERKQAFSEFLVQKQQEEAEEKRIKQKKTREEFKKMLEEREELTSSTRWSKAVTMLEDDERFKALEDERDRRDIFEDYIDELKEKERMKAQAEHKQNIIEYRKFLESCNFIKMNSQWRKVQDRLEADERCLRLEKIDRIKNFQEYLHDLEREEEEKRKIQKEEIKRAERKNRDEFRKLMDEHIATGILTAKTSWHDYFMKVRDSLPFSTISSNASGAAAKDLFEDVVEDLQKQYREDKSRIKDALKLRKITIFPVSTLDDLKVSISEDVSSPPISDTNLKLIFDGLLERAKEKKGKEARKRKRFAEDLVAIFRSFKDITASSSWEDCKHFVERSKECSSLGDESFQKQIFEEYVSSLKKQAKELKQEEEKRVQEEVREERDRRKAKDRREKDRVQERDNEDRHKKAAVDDDNYDTIEVHENEHRRSGRDRDNKHRRRLSSLKENETDHRKDTHKHHGDHKKSRQQRLPKIKSEDDGRGKRRRKHDQNGILENGDDDEELEDGECGRY